MREIYSRKFTYYSIIATTTVIYTMYDIGDDITLHAAALNLHYIIVKHKLRGIGVAYI